MIRFARSQPSATDAIECLQKAAKLNWEDPYRHGCMLQMPNYGQLVMTGDLHGHFRNFDRLKKYANLERTPARHVVLHEMVHKELPTMQDVDDSHLLLVECAAYKCEYPDQVHFLQSNHELAQLTGYNIAKNGRIVIDAYNQHVITTYGERDGHAVLRAMEEFIASFPLAIRTENRVWLSHSLPDMHHMDEFDADTFERDCGRADIEQSRTAFLLVWGRRHSTEHVQRLCEKFDVDVIMTGHQPQEMGSTLVFERLIILDSSHNHGSFLAFDLSRPVRAEDLFKRIRKFVEIV